MMAKLLCFDSYKSTKRQLVTYGDKLRLHSNVSALEHIEENCYFLDGLFIIIFFLIMKLSSLTPEVYLKLCK